MSERRCPYCDTGIVKGDEEMCWMCESEKKDEQDDGSWEFAPFGPFR